MTMLHSHCQSLLSHDSCFKFTLPHTVKLCNLPINFITYFSDRILCCDWYTLHAVSDKPCLQPLPSMQNRVWPCKASWSRRT